MNVLLASSLLALSLAVSPSYANPSAPQQAKTVNAAAAKTVVKPAARPAAQSTRLNINTASAEQIAKGLNGIGLKKAQAIVAYRKANGPFKSVAELVEVKGIGPAIVERNLNQMTVR